MEVALFFAQVAMGWALGLFIFMLSIFSIVALGYVIFDRIQKSRRR